MLGQLVKQSMSVRTRTTAEELLGLVDHYQICVQDDQSAGITHLG